MQWFSQKRESPEEYWRRTEEELGETILLSTIGKCLEGCGAGEVEVWGLLFVTDRAVYFRHFPSVNWFTAMMQSMTDPTSPREGIYFSIPRDDIDEVTVQREPSLLRRIFSYSPPSLRISYRDQHNVRTVLRFVPESKAENVRELLVTQ